MRMLILGGGTFVGRALIDAAVAAGHDVTVLTRTTKPAAGVESLHADRTTAAGLEVLGDREWDAVFDTWSGEPRAVRLSASTLAGRVGYYSYVSTASVYDEPVAGSDESHPTVAADPDAQATDYAADKRGAELAVIDAFGERHSLLARAGIIVGPYENTGRLVWWLRRIAVGGDVLAPGPADAPLQWVDARDLAQWQVRCAEQGVGGAFSAISAPGFCTFGEVLRACLDRTASGARLVWTPPAFVLAKGIEPWTELPLWLPPGADFDSVYGLDTRRAAAAGLVCRPLVETVADTWAWMQAGGTPRSIAGRRAPGLDADKERAALAALQAPTFSLGGIVLDAPNPGELARFYLKLLAGWTLATDESDWAQLRPPGGGRPALSFQEEPNYVRPVWPAGPGDPQMSAHLDIQVNDLDSAGAHAVAAGAVLAEHQPQDDVRVYFDPAGHPFCLFVT